MSGRAHNFKDISGQKFGKWTVIGLCPRTGPRHVRWLVKCDCGKGPFSVQGTTLRRGESLQCRYHSQKHKIRPGQALRKLFRQYKDNAKDRNLEWGLTLEEFHSLTSANCHYTNRKPSIVMKARGGERYIFNGLDRLDNSKGYIVGNVVPCCRDANYAKLALSESDFLQLVREIAIWRELL